MPSPPTSERNVNSWLAAPLHACAVTAVVVASRHHPVRAASRTVSCVPSDDVTGNQASEVLPMLNGAVAAVALVPVSELTVSCTACAGDPAVEPAMPSAIVESSSPAVASRLVAAHTSVPGAVSTGPHLSTVTASPASKKPLDSDRHSFLSPIGEMKNIGVDPDDRKVANRWLLMPRQVATSSAVPTWYLARATSRHSLVS